MQHSQRERRSRVYKRKRFVIVGDQNADPFDGDSTSNAINQLLDNPLINTSVTPDSEGGVDAGTRQGGANETHVGNPAFDTADFKEAISRLYIWIHTAIQQRHL